MSSPSQLSIKNRVEKIKESTQQSNQPEVSSKFDQITISSPLVTDEKEEDNNSNPEQLKTLFKQAINSTNKDKFGYFLQQANEMSQNYEKEIADLKQRMRYFQDSKLIYSPFSSTITFSYCPTREEAFVFKMKQITQEEKGSIDEVCAQYNKKMSELFKENDDLTKMIDKISNKVITKLQEKIQELSDLYDNEKLEREKAESQIKSLDSIYQQNSDIKESNIEKDKYIIELNSKMTDLERDLMQEKAQNNYITNLLETFKDNVEEKEKKVVEHVKVINELKANIEKNKKTISQKDKEMQEKEDELKVLYDDNVKWEEKYNLQAKEVENYKKWSLWDEDLVESYKKIDLLQNDISALKSEIEDLKEENHKTMKENESMTDEIKENKLKLLSYKNENDVLLITKLIYEKEKEKIDKYDSMVLENIKLKNDSHSIAEKYENQMRGEKKTFESQLQALKIQRENDIKNNQIQYENDIREKSDLIQSLESKLNTITNENKELISQVDSKHQMTLNLKEAYDNLIKKYKSQEEKVQALEKGHITINNQISIEKPIIQEKEGGKIYSSFDKYAFTTELLVDYLYCLFLFESSVSVQNFLDILLGNMNSYINTLFQNQQQSGSIVSEFIEDIFFLSYNKLYEKRIKSNSEDAKSYIVNFEQFDRRTIEEICKEMAQNNPLATFKSKKSFEQLVNLFIGKYENSFDFDDDFQSYLEKEIIPLVEIKIKKNETTIKDDLHTLVEMTLNNIKDGRINVNDSEIYSYEHYFNQFKNMEMNENQTSLTVKEELTMPTAVDNVAFCLKRSQLTEVQFSKMFNWNTEMSLTKIVTTMIMYCSNLISFSFKGNSVSGYLFKTQVNKLIKSFKNLRVLDLSNNSLTDEDIQILCDSIKNNNTIEELILDYNKITSGGGYYLADAFTKNNTVSSLSLNGNQLNDAGLTSLFNALSTSNTSIRKLFIGDNSLSKEDYFSLTEYLNVDPILTLLDISGNTIDVKSANILGISFRKAKRLKVLYANLMKLNEESCPTLLNYLHETEITEIHLDNIEFGDTGSILFINKIKLCSQLEKVSLKMCGIPPMFLTLFAQIFKNKSNLLEINLEKNFIEDVILINFAKAIESNQSLVAKFSKNGLSDKTIESLSASRNIILI